MNFLIYTSVFDHYDWVFPPVTVSDDVSYVLVTDDPDMRVSGWRTLVVEKDRFESSRAANRYFKMLPQRAFPDFDYSLYIDGNIRLLGDIKPVFDEFVASNSCVGLFRHPVRNSVKEEVDACSKFGKVVDVQRLQKEWSFYCHEGFTDNIGLFEAGVMLKNHSHPRLDDAMGYWWELFEQFNSRDQFSLPYVLWKSDIPFVCQNYSFRDPNPFFGIYAHRGDHRAPRHYAYVQGRSYDSIFYSTLLKTWHLTWNIRRSFRKQ